MKEQERRNTYQTVKEQALYTYLRSPETERDPENIDKKTYGESPSCTSNRANHKRETRREKNFHRDLHR